MRSSNYSLRGFQQGAATSAAKMGRSVGFRAKRRQEGEVTETQLISDIRRGARFFWANRAQKGIFCDGPTFEGQMRAAAIRKHDKKKKAKKSAP